MQQPAAALTLRSIAPADAATQVPLNAPVSVDMSHPLAPASLNTASFVIKQSATQRALPAILENSVNGGRLIPTWGLALAARHEVHLANTIRSTEGDLFPGAVTSFFTLDGQWNDNAGPRSVSGAPYNDRLRSAQVVMDKTTPGQGVAGYLKNLGNQGDQLYATFFNTRYETATSWGVTHGGSAVQSFKLVKLPGNGVMALYVQERPGVPGYQVWASRGIWRSDGYQTWSVASNLSAGVDTPSDLDAAVDPADGSVVAVWRQRGYQEGRLSSVHTSRFVPGQGWSPTQSLRRGSTAQQRNPRIAVDGAGNHLVAWNEDNAVAGARRLKAAGAWGERFVIHTGPSYPGVIASFALAMNARGDAVVATQDAQNGQFRIWARRARNGSSTFEAAQPVKHVTTEYEFDLQVGVDASGNAIAAWGVARNRPLNDLIYANRMDAATGLWGQELEIGVSNAGGAARANNKSPILRVDANGNAMIAWQEDSLVEPGRFQHWVIRYNAQNGWVERMPRVFAIHSADAPGLDIDAHGLVARVWAQQNLNGTYEVMWEAYR